jgi:hypothetical protein
MMPAYLPLLFLMWMPALTVTPLLHHLSAGPWVKHTGLAALAAAFPVEETHGQ